jgi:hypothetical protein
VDIGIWNQAGVHGAAEPDRGGDEGTHLTAWHASPDTVAWEVWGQILDSYSNRQVINGGEWVNAWPHFPWQGLGASPRAIGHIPQPSFYHLDDAITPTPGRRDNYGFLVNVVDQYRKRPGDPVGGYEIHLNRFVLAGTHLQTFTRVTSMEAANESARHAVNAILNHRQAGYAGELSRVWDPEENEIDDLQFLKELDDELFARGEPHIADILDVDAAIDNLFP